MISTLKICVPINWKTVRLGDVADYYNGRAFKPLEWEQEGVPIIRIQNLNKPEAEYNYTTQKHEDRYLVKRGDLLFAWSASLGAYIWKGNDAWLNQHIFKVVLRNGVDKMYLFYLLNKIVAELYAKTHGSGMVHITKGKFESTLIPLPPLAEQHRIVAKIEELFSEMDNAVENIRQAKARLKTYRQAVLKWAFEGRLTKEWRNKSTSLNEKIGIAAEDSILYARTKSIPNEWSEVELIKLGSWKGGGTPSKSNKAFWNNGTILWVSPKDMKNKYIDDTIDKITMEAIEGSSAKVIEKKSVLFVIRSGILRRILPIGVTNFDVTVNQDMQAFTPGNKLLPEYTYWFCVANEYDIRNTCAKDGTTVESIDTKALKSYKITLTNLKEQQQIVQEIESRLSLADHMEQTIDQSLQQAEALRQSILKRAFEGKLVKNE